MATTSRQTAIFGVEDWKRFYQTYREADFQSYDFETLRKSFVDYLRLYYPETFNDFVESSEFIALLDIIAFMGQSLAFRSDLNARENFLETAERRESVVKIAEMVSYTPKRNETASGMLKIFSINTTENIIDYNGNNLANVTINWDDATNTDWYEQLVVIMNSALVDSQRIGRPGATNSVLGVDTQEYSLSSLPDSNPIYSFSAKVNNIAMSFETVSATVQDGRVIEKPPSSSGIFNLLYRNDRLGFASDNTGFFLFFKQGELQAQDFTLEDRIPNRTVPIDVTGVNETDVWLYTADQAGNYIIEWDKVDSLVSVPDQQNNSASKRFYTLTSGANDSVEINFGDGVFTEIPVGRMRAFVRQSNGLEYVVNPEEMRAITLEIPYVSRTGRVETLTVTSGLTTAVSNAKTREGIDDIKARAPARFYTQNRMVNGEDYNNFPFTQYGSIIKSKAVNRSTIGASRYLDLVDITGKYSSTNVFAADGILYERTQSPTFTFSWTDLNDIADVLANRVEPILASRDAAHFYYKKDNFARPSVAINQLSWVMKTTQFNETTGYFINQATTPQAIGVFTSDNRRYLTVASLVKFIPPTGYYFTDTNKLKAGTPAAGELSKPHVWASISAIETDGANYGNNGGALDDGSGPVSLNTFIPTTAIPTEVIPVFVTDLPATLEQEITQQVSLNADFGIGYDHLQGEWAIVELPENDTGLWDSNDPSANWFVKFTTDGSVYTVTNRAVGYFFASVLETRFFYDGSQQVYDPKTGTIVNDYIRLLKTNTKPDSVQALERDSLLDITGQPVEDDGYVNDFLVSVSFTDLNMDGVADDPDFFDYLVSPDSVVFTAVSVNADGLQEVIPLPSGTINTEFDTVGEVELNKFSYDVGQLFYTPADPDTDTLEKILEITEDTSGNRLLVERIIAGQEGPNETAEFIVDRGRQDLQFQYRHNSPVSRRIDPGTTNIIDLYLVTNAYYTAYQNYLRDSTGTLTEPTRPTIDELSVAYAGLNDYKMLSDSLVINSVTFKPLFGEKALPELRATIKVVRAAKERASDSEIKSRVVHAINNFFTIDKWDFGSTFYFSELSAFLHKELGEIISSAVLVPADPAKRFGNLYEIRSAPNEIFVTAATVNDIEVIETITSGNIRSE